MNTAVTGALSSPPQCETTAASQKRQTPLLSLSSRQLPLPSPSVTDSPSRLPKPASGAMSIHTRSRTLAMRSSDDGGKEKPVIFDSALGKRRLGMGDVGLQGRTTDTAEDDSVEGEVDDFGRQRSGAKTKHQLQDDIENSPRSTALKRNHKTLMECHSGALATLPSSPAHAGSRATLRRTAGGSGRTGTVSTATGDRWHTTSPSSFCVTERITASRQRTQSRIPGLTARPHLSSGSTRGTGPVGESGSSRPRADSIQSSQTASTASEIATRDGASGLITFGGSQTRIRSFSFSSQPLTTSNHDSHTLKEARKPSRDLPGPPNSLRSRHGVRQSMPSTSGTAPIASTKADARPRREGSTPSFLHPSTRTKDNGSEGARNIQSPERNRYKATHSQTVRLPQRSLFAKVVGSPGSRKQTPQQFLQTPEARERAMKRMSGHLAFPMTGKLLDPRPLPSLQSHVAATNEQAMELPGIPSAAETLAESRARSPLLASSVGDESIDIRALCLSPAPDSPIIGLQYQALPVQSSKARAAVDHDTVPQVAATESDSPWNAQPSPRSSSSPMQTRDARSSNQGLIASNEALLIVHSPGRSLPEGDEVNDSAMVIEQLRRQLAESEQKQQKLAVEAEHAESALTAQAASHAERLALLRKGLSAAEDRATDAERRAKEHEKRRKEEWEETQAGLAAARDGQAKQISALSESVQRTEHKYTKIREMAATTLAEQALTGWTFLAPAARSEAQTAAHQMEMCRLALHQLNLLESVVRSACHVDTI